MIDLKKIRMYYLISDINFIKNIKYFGGALHFSLTDNSTLSVIKISESKYSIHNDKRNKYFMVNVRTSEELISYIDDVLSSKVTNYMENILESI